MIRLRLKRLRVGRSPLYTMRPVFHGKAILLLVTFFALGFAQGARAQHVGVSTNLLYWATASPNISLEYRTGAHTSMGWSAGYNPFKFPNRVNADGVEVNPKLMHWSVGGEWRYWPCRPFERFYFGVHALGGEYNVGGLGFLGPAAERRYAGGGVGGGLGIGYQWALGRRWGLNLALGAGYVYLRYDRYDCGACGDRTGSFGRHYVGPTKACVSFVYFIR